MLCTTKYRVLKCILSSNTCFDEFQIFLSPLAGISSILFVSWQVPRIIRFSHLREFSPMSAVGGFPLCSSLSVFEFFDLTNFYVRLWCRIFSTSPPSGSTGLTANLDTIPVSRNYLSAWQAVLRKNMSKWHAVTGSTWAIEMHSATEIVHMTLVLRKHSASNTEYREAHGKCHTVPPNTCVNNTQPHQTQEAFTRSSATGYLSVQYVPLCLRSLLWMLRWMAGHLERWIRRASCSLTFSGALRFAVSSFDCD